MTKRDVGFLLVGIGIGTFCAGSMSFVLLRQIFILNMHWTQGSAIFAFPFLLIGLGVLLYDVNAPPAEGAGLCVPRGLLL